MNNKFVCDLPYALNALSPYMSEETVDLHYNKHHIGYFNKLKDKFPHIKTLQEGIENKDSFNLAGQILNHNIFWKSLTPYDGGRKGFDKIKYDVSYDEIIQEAITVGMKHFGSGWLWMIEKNNKIEFVSTMNADIPTEIEKLIWVIDLWEHSFYLNYKNDKKKYLNTILEHLINWNMSLDESEKSIFSI